MTAQEKQVITCLRNQGLGYKRIAAQTGIPENTVRCQLAGRSERRRLRRHVDHFLDTAMAGA